MLNNSLRLLVWLAIGTLVTANAEERSGASWLVARGDAQATGVAYTELPAKPEMLWKFALPKGSFEATAAIDNGLVFLGDMDAKCYALKLATGEKVWEQPGTLGFPGSPAVKDGKVYVGDGDGLFHCYEAATGKELWKYATEAEIVAGANFWKDKVLVGSQDSRLYALDVATGELAWKLQIENQIRSMTTVAGDSAFVVQCDGKLHVVNLNTGKIEASVPLNQPNTTSSPAVLGDHLFFGTEEGAVMCIDWKKAKIEWQVTDQNRPQPYRSSPAINDTMVVIGGRGKRVIALSPHDGKELWSFATKNRVDCSPVIAGKHVVVGAADGRLYLIDRETGKEVWHFECQGGINGGIAVADGKFIVATDRGVVYCFGTK